MSCAGIEAIVIVGEDGGSVTQHMATIQANHRFLISSVCDPSWATQRLALLFPPKQDSCLPRVDVLKELSRGYKVASNHKACQQDLGLPNMMTIQRMRSRRPHTPYGFSHARLPRTPFLRRSSSSEARGGAMDGHLKATFASSWISRRDVVASPMETFSRLGEKEKANLALLQIGVILSVYERLTGCLFRGVYARLLHADRLSKEFPSEALQAHLTQSAGCHYQSQGYIIYPRLYIDSGAGLNSQPNSVARAIDRDKCEEGSAP
ncbi:hypothetical protein FFLO_04069 [Filobasidium floriforme]|uniref:Uncharacterized protein n=1 Tax=Filobasidium floriforme TaxID=5210 RepID=A0A8K0NQ91_9TREE|nr:uncharacterized protein HD553DRAFT_357972 [Filobasidium floriforme]KAG7531843.1 hypothetical protein FFLO_04069 [Filobasidium floriforme]KAH8082662.1 hypothetical protein HD553DRAFT_357972 [Filobasidium floriforme]